MDAGCGVVKLRRMNSIKIPGVSAAVAAIRQLMYWPSTHCGNYFVYEKPWSATHLAHNQARGAPISWMHHGARNGRGWSTYTGKNFGGQGVFPPYARCVVVQCFNSVRAAFAQVKKALFGSFSKYVANQRDLYEWRAQITLLIACLESGRDRGKDTARTAGAPTDRRVLRWSELVQGAQGKL